MTYRLFTRAGWLLVLFAFVFYGGKSLGWV